MQILLLKEILMDFRNAMIVLQKEEEGIIYSSPFQPNRAFPSGACLTASRLVFLFLKRKYSVTELPMRDLIQHLM